jgi:hypothetical protein
VVPPNLRTNARRASSGTLPIGPQASRRSPSTSRYRCGSSTKSAR